MELDWAHPQKWTDQHQQSHGKTVDCAQSTLEVVYNLRTNFLENYRSIRLSTELSGPGLYCVSCCTLGNEYSVLFSWDQNLDGGRVWRYIVHVF